MPRAPIYHVTAAHKRILDGIKCLVEKEMPVTVGALVSELGLAGSTSLVPTLKIMQRNGYIQIQGGGERGRRQSIVLTQSGKSAIGVGGIPLLGAIPAGPLNEILEQSDTWIAEDALLGQRPGDFLLSVEGDSMIGDGILPGDKVLLRPGIHVNNGDIAAVHVGTDYLATLKHVHFNAEQDIIILKASNPEYEDVIMSNGQVRIAGVYRGLIRNI